MRYDTETLNKIDGSINLVEYISTFLPLERRGGKGDYFCCCPWHIDKTPSFSVNENANKFYCFSCGRGGGLINFIRLYNNIPFDAAVEKAIEVSEIDCSEICTSKSISFLRDYNTPAQERKAEHKIFEKNMYERYSKEPIISWEEEGISSEVMELFEVRVDKFANRIVYPVYDSEGNFINIKGRTLYDNFKDLHLPKYINYYTVGVMDYFQGYNITKPYIEQSNEVIIFESIKSVMKAFQWGYKNCISAEKHTLTNEQLNILVGLKKNVVFAFDTDVDYNSPDVKKTLDQLNKITNVYIVKDVDNVLGGIDAKNSPVDCGKDAWDFVYSKKVKYVGGRKKI